jgi:TonB family protein
MKAVVLPFLYGSLLLGLVAPSSQRVFAQAVAESGSVAATDSRADTGLKISVAPRPVVVVRPNFPKKGRKKKNGMVQLRATVTVEGDLKNLAVMSGDHDLAEASLVALRQWRYEPSRINGVPVETPHDITIIFPRDTDAVYLGADDLSAGVQLEPSQEIKNELMNGEIVHVFKGTTPPQAIYAPDPAYSETARQSKYQGVCVLSAIVGTDGNVRESWVTRPVGEGLDEQALATIRRWRFKPAIRNTEPVTALVTIEVAFHLY